MRYMVAPINDQLDGEPSSGDIRRRYRRLGLAGFVTLLLVAAYATSPMDRSSNLRSAVFTPMQTDDTAGGWTTATDGSSTESTSESRLRTVNIGMGCPEFQVAFDGETPGSPSPFRSFTLTKGVGYAHVALHFSTLWLPRGASVVLRAVEGFDTPDRYLNLSEKYPSGRMYYDVLASPVLTKEFRIEFYRSKGAFDSTDDDLIAETFSATDSNAKCYGFALDSYYYVLMDDASPIVSTDETLCVADNTKRAICYYSDNATQTAYLASRAVARLNTPKGFGESAICTGWLLGNQGHILTNYHCVSTVAEATGTTVEFMAEDGACSDSISCDLSECGGELVSFTTDLVYSSEELKLDNALLKLPTIGAQTAQTYGYLRLKTRDGVVGEQLYIPQHLMGKSKRISLEDDYAGKRRHKDWVFWVPGAILFGPRLHHCGEMCGNTGTPAKRIVADLMANGIDVAAFDGVDDGSSHTANSERFPAYTPPVPEATLPLTSRLTLDGAIILGSGYVSVDKVKFTLTRDTDVSFAVVSVEIADNGSFIDLNGDCRANYLDSIIYLFPKDGTAPVFFADDGGVTVNVEGDSISYNDLYMLAFLKKESYVLAVASMGSSAYDALTGKTKAEYPPKLYSCRSRSSYGSYRLKISSSAGENPFTFTKLPAAIAIDPTSCHKTAQAIAQTKLELVHSELG